MKIIVVEDNKNKYTEIAHVLKEINNITVELAEEYAQAREKLRKNNYDMLILDMTLPHDDIRRGIRSYAGKELMFDMLDDKISVPTIVITGYLDFGSKEKKKIIYDELPIAIKNEKYEGRYEEELEKKYDISNFYGIHEYLSDNIPFYIGILYFSLQRSEWKKELLQLIEEQMRKNNESLTFRGYRDKTTEN